MLPSLPTSRRQVCALVLAATAGLAAGCIKEKESLIIVSITAEIDLPDANQVDIVAGTTQRGFALTGLTRMVPVRRGIYVDAKTVGEVSVQVSLRAGTPCAIYSKSSTASVPSAGAPAPPDPAAKGPVLVARPGEPPPGEREHPVYTRWWFWTAIGVVVAGGVAAALLIPGGTTRPACFDTAPGSCK